MADLEHHIQTLMAKCQTMPDDIEQLFLLKTYCETDFPEQIASVKKQVSYIFSVIDFLDSFNIKLKFDDYSLKWSFLSIPSQMSLQAYQCLNQISTRKNFLFNEMIMQQNQFKRKIDGLEKEILAFQSGQVTDDVEEIKAMATKANQFREQLENSKLESEKFNVMETVFQKDQTDYTKILQIDKDFVYYHKIWTTAEHFYCNHNSWLKSNLQTTNWNPIQRFIANSTTEIS